ncbi:uncharacterized protein CANTADRAFT_12395 [Suhomyces tanzawaensis NRRL Y-17324]|uniref:D-serine dehydratase n=1 Tax=Suhomyces tanzawaensis NRRL Y-17324 TaxID=984487 RepID=A0A1E4SE24_9ASCO|nr:uncharacterized protein CANTADRAFT_12395 [Suhomyces tanzawaensis NRRL Y-17324]ODV77774.1 hypothetical protein CANTADRAFT_12395 [Suhomyces tanzawaensis NRRL Y-17324]
MTYPSLLTPLADKHQVLAAYQGKHISELPTPSVVIDRTKFQKNCDRMLENAHKLNAGFRAHIKTHKTLEGTLLQLGSGAHRTQRLVVSTTREAWNILPLVEQGLVSDILFSLPVVKSRLPELAELATKVPQLRLMLDNTQQLDTLAEFREAHPETKKWSVYVKIDMGTSRAGLINDTKYLDELLAKLLKDDRIRQHVDTYGFYCHAGHSYASDSENKAKDFLLQEITHANAAAAAAMKLDPSASYHISVGATPTAHASELLTTEELAEKFEGGLAGKLELHAGNYPCCDLQQLSTGCITEDNISFTLIADVLSTYPERGNKAPGEQLINAGAIALAREFGPVYGHGRIMEPRGYENWVVGRLSQEHGILVPLDETKKTEFLPINTRVRVIPQHSCITAAAHPWFYIVDEKDVVVDVWVPATGW